MPPETSNLKSRRSECIDFNSFHSFLDEFLSFKWKKFCQKKFRSFQFASSNLNSEFLTFVIFWFQIQKENRPKDTEILVNHADFVLKSWIYWTYLMVPRLDNFPLHISIYTLIHFQSYTIENANDIAHWRISPMAAMHWNFPTFHLLGVQISFSIDKTNMFWNSFQKKSIIFSAFLSNCFILKPHKHYYLPCSFVPALLSIQSF